MALPAHVLDRLSPAFNEAGVRLARQAKESTDGSAGALGFGIPELDEVLPDGGLLRSSVVELCVSGEGALGTSLSLALCAHAQANARARGAEPPWCAFVDPSRTLYGPGVAAAGVELSRLLVIRPTLAALSRATLRLAESRAFAVIVVDLTGSIGERVVVPLGTWPRVVRRLALAIEGSGHSVVLLTRDTDRRPLPLPVAQRLEVSRPSAEKLMVRLAKDQRGRILSPRGVAWTRGYRWNEAVPNQAAPQNENGIRDVRRFA